MNGESYRLGPSKAPPKTRLKPPTNPTSWPSRAKAPGNLQRSVTKRGRPDAGAHSRGISTNPKWQRFCAALWLTFTLPLTLSNRAPWLPFNRLMSDNHLGGADNQPWPGRGLERQDGLARLEGSPPA